MPIFSRNVLIWTLASAAVIAAQAAHADNVDSNVTVNASLSALPSNSNVQVLDLGAANTAGLVTGQELYFGAGDTIQFSGSAGVYEGTASGVAAAPWTSTGAQTSNYIAAEPNGAVTINYAQNQEYFGLNWGSVDAYNTLSFYEGNKLVDQFTGSQVELQRAWQPAGGRIGHRKLRFHQRSRLQQGGPVLLVARVRVRHDRVQHGRCSHDGDRRRNAGGGERLHRRVGDQGARRRGAVAEARLDAAGHVRACRGGGIGLPSPGARIGGLSRSALTTRKDRRAAAATAGFGWRSPIGVPALGASICQGARCGGPLELAAPTLSWVRTCP